MEFSRAAVIGLGATGQALAAALVTSLPDTMLLVTNAGARDSLLRDPLKIDGVMSFSVRPTNVEASIKALDAFKPDVVFIATKTFHLERVAEELAGLTHQDFHIVSCHNGLGPEDYLAERFGSSRVLRMSLNYGAYRKSHASSTTTFFNSPNFLGAAVPEGAEAARAAASLLTGGGLATAFADDIKETVWKKMIMKCSMASLGAITDMSIRENLSFPPTREIAFGCFREALAVAKAFGYDFGEEYLAKAVAYIEEVGVHKDSMCHDIASGTRTEIDYLGGRIVDYGKEKGIPTPCFNVTTALVRALEQKGASLKD